MRGQYRKSSQYTFVNPYNFVRSNVRSKGSREEGRLEKERDLPKRTGVLNCRLIVKTPLAIPGKLLSEKDEHKEYDFFEYEDGVPAIPGSSLRGAIRSIFETVSDSCFSTAKEDQVITVRGKNALRPGILKKEADGWSLYAVQRYLVKVTDRDYKPFAGGPEFSVNRGSLLNIGYGAAVRFCTDDIEQQVSAHMRGKYVTGIDRAGKAVGRGWHTGYLFLGELFPRKHFESIFYLPENPHKVEALTSSEIETALRKLDEVYRVYNDASVNRNLKGGKFYQGYEAARKRGLLPIWWENDKSAGLHLSLACIGRQAAARTMGDILQEKAPCKDRGCLCEACALFGMTAAPGSGKGGKRGQSLGSRVRITDALPDVSALPKGQTGENPFYTKKKLTLKELSSPKISYMPFYTMKPVSGAWNYDNKGTEIRGRKYYWHGRPQEKNAPEQNDRNATMQLVRPDVEFTFQVYYDGITEDQYKKLLWTLTLGDNRPESPYCYKLGHGKPLGLGSVKILAERNTWRENGAAVSETGAASEEMSAADAEERQTREKDLEISREFCYRLESEKLTGKPDVENPFSGGVSGELLQILDRRIMTGQDVTYPYVVAQEGTTVPDDDKNSLASHQWFGKNYKFGSNGDPEQPLNPLGRSAVRSVRNTPAANSFVMHAYEFSDAQSNGKSGGNGHYGNSGGGYGGRGNGWNGQTSGRGNGRYGQAAGSRNYGGRAGSCGAGAGVRNSAAGNHLQPGNVQEAVVTNLDRFGNAWVSIGESMQGMIPVRDLSGLTLSEGDRLRVKYVKTNSGGKHLYAPEVNR